MSWYILGVPKAIIPHSTRLRRFLPVQAVSAPPAPNPSIPEITAIALVADVARKKMSAMTTAIYVRDVCRITASQESTLGPLAFDLAGPNIRQAWLTIR